MIAHLDLDFIVYAVGASCEGIRYHYRNSEYAFKKDLNKILKAEGADPSCVIETRNPEPWEKVQSSVISYLEGIIAPLGCGYQGYISGHGNFRYELATILPYKGNRSAANRPYHYDNIRQFLVEFYSAKVSDGMEADDLIGLSHDPEEDIIVTRDKDLNCIPGLHYNWATGLCEYVFPIQADRHFYGQVLTGDSVDNIPGLYGVGADSQYVKNLQTMTTTEEMFKAVRCQYKARFGNYWEQFFLENCNLLWILQRREKSWKPFMNWEIDEEI